MNNSSLKLLAAAVTASLAIPAAFAQNATTTPVGAVTFDLPRNSDTRVAVPLERPSVFRGPVASRNGFTIDVSATANLASLTSVPHYVQATEGDQQGIIFDVLSNTATSITLANNGLEPTGLVAGSDFKVVPYWTLATLFPATDQNVSFTPSASTTGVARRTQVLLPNIVGTGINRAPAASFFFVTNTFWRSTSATSIDAGNTPLPPDSFIIVRNPSTAADGLKLTTTGSVNTDAQAIQLDRISGASNDNYVAAVIPVDTALDDLNLVTSGAFTASAATTGVARRDQLLRYNNSVIGLNKAPSATYYYLNTGVIQGWRSTASSTTDAGPTILPAGTSIVIRKYQSATPTTQFWNYQLTLAN